MKHYYISMGSNIGDSRKIMEEAIKTLQKEEGLFLMARSSFYVTKPWGKTDQPDFLNAVIRIAWEKSSEELLETLLRVEKEFGRKRLIHWGPRTLDLDIIWCDEEQVEKENLKIPHPYFWDRLFVLEPLKEINPEFQYRGESIQSRITALKAQNS